MSEAITNANPTSAARHRQTIKGLVVGDKLAKSKTKTIEVKRSLPHKLYHKQVQRRTKYLIHDEHDKAKLGDFVLAVSTRPISKNKHFRFLKTIKGVQE